jgi:hypothetical protein
MGWGQNKKKYSILVEKSVGKKNNLVDTERGR